MISNRMYTIIKKIDNKLSNYTEFLVIDRCVIDYDPDSIDYIDSSVDIMENNLAEHPSHEGDVHVFESGCCWEWFGTDDISRCYSEISSYFGIEPAKMSFLNNSEYSVMTSKAINELFDKFS